MINNNEYYMGYVVNSNDPECRGRCQIRVYGVFDNVPDADLPFASPITSNIFSGKAKGSGAFSYPKTGSLVRVKFNNGNIYEPEYYAVEELNDAMVAELTSDYENSHVILYDEDEKVKIMYQKNKGITIFKDGSSIKIDKDNNIKLQHSDGCTSIHFGKNGDMSISGANCVYLESPHNQIGKSGSHPVMKGDLFSNFMTQLCAIIDTKMPAVPAATPLWQAMQGPIMSSQVFIGD